MRSRPGQWFPLVVALGAFGCQAERREPDETDVVVAQSQNQRQFVSAGQPAGTRSVRT